MAASTNSSGARLYNNPHLSDIKILQTCDGITTEYFAHKAILANQSDWFATAFFGNFKEATAEKIDLHDDNPAHFEIMMKFFYKHDWINVLANKQEQFVTRMDAVGVHNVADKYGFKPLKDALASKFKKLPGSFNSTERIQIVKGHYDHCCDKKCKFGEAIAVDFVQETGQNTFMKIHGRGLVKEYPRFARHIILASADNGYSDIWR